jgi:hypothetical protein
MTPLLPLIRGAKSSLYRSLGTHLSGAVALTAVDLAATVAQASLQPAPDAASGAVALDLVTAFLLVYLLRIFVRAILRPMVVRAHARTAEGSATALVWSADRAVPFVLVAVAADFLPVAGATLAALPGAFLAMIGDELRVSLLFDFGLALALVFGVATYVYLWLGLSLTDWVVSLEARSAKQSLERALELAAHARARIAVVQLIVAAVQVLGVLTIVGWPIARAIGDALTTQLYRDLARQHGGPPRTSVAPSAG